MLTAVEPAPSASFFVAAARPPAGFGIALGRSVLHEMAAVAVDLGDDDVAVALLGGASDRRPDGRRPSDRRPDGRRPSDWDEK
jgi:hypothetical protein